MQDDDRRAGEDDGLMADIRRIVEEEGRPRPPTAFEPASAGGVFALTPAMRAGATPFGAGSPRAPLAPAEDEEPPLILTRRVDQPEQPFGSGSAGTPPSQGRPPAFHAPEDEAPSPASAFEPDRAKSTPPHAAPAPADETLADPAHAASASGGEESSPAGDERARARLTRAAGRGSRTGGLRRDPRRASRRRSGRPAAPRPGAPGRRAFPCASRRREGRAVARHRRRAHPADSARPSVGRPRRMTSAAPSPPTARPGRSPPRASPAAGRSFWP